MASLLLALTALDLGVYLVGTRVQQFNGLILELPHIAVQTKTRFRLGLVDSLTGDQLRGFNSYGRCPCYQRLLSRAGRQAEAEQPNHEQACCCV